MGRRDGQNAESDNSLKNRVDEIRFSHFSKHGATKPRSFEQNNGLFVGRREMRSDTCKNNRPTHSLLSSIRPTHTRQHKVEISARVAHVKHGVVGHKDVRGQFVRQRCQEAVIARAKKGRASQHGAVQRPAVWASE